MFFVWPLTPWTARHAETLALRWILVPMQDEKHSVATELIRVRFARPPFE
jgi:hypothetical protein